MESPTANLEAFVSQLVEEKGLNYLDEETLTQVKSDLMERLENRINAVIIANLPSADLVDFEQKLESKISEEEIQAYCSTKIPNLPEIVAAELLAFRQSYLNG